MERELKKQQRDEEQRLKAEAKAKRTIEREEQKPRRKLLRLNKKQLESKARSV